MSAKRVPMAFNVSNSLRLFLSAGKHFNPDNTDAVATSPECEITEKQTVSLPKSCKSCPKNSPRLRVRSFPLFPPLFSLFSLHSSLPRGARAASVAPCLRVKLSCSWCGRCGAESFANAWQFSFDFANVWQNLKIARRMDLPMFGIFHGFLPRIGKTENPTLFTFLS